MTEYEERKEIFWIKLHYQVENHVLGKDFPILTKLRLFVQSK